MKLSAFFKNKKKDLQKAFNAMSKERMRYLQYKISEIEYSVTMSKVMKKVIEAMDNSVEMTYLTKAALYYIDAYKNDSTIEMRAWDMFREAINKL